MATNMFRKYTESKTAYWEVPAGTGSGALVIHPLTSEVGVTIAAAGGVKGTKNLADGSVLTNINIGGVGYEADTAEVARDGSWLFEVAGVTAGETVAGTGTDQGTTVYRDAAGALTLSDTEADGVTATTAVAIIDDCTIVDGVAAIEIGVL